MTLIGIALSLVMLLSADPASAPPAPTPPVGRVIGRVYGVGRDTAGIPYANVMVLGTRLGTMTDETGAYVMVRIPAGRIELKIQAIGFPTLIGEFEVVAGQTVRRDFWLTVRPSSYDKVKDSLEALGQWPPKLDPGLLEHMRATRDVRVFRLGEAMEEFFGAPPDPKHRIGAWPIVGEARRPDRDDIAGLVDALLVSPYQLPPLEGRPIKACGGFTPGIDVRFTHEGIPVDVLLCYRCGEISIMRGGYFVQAGDFADARFVEFAKRAFPNDPEIRRLASPAEQH